MRENSAGAVAPELPRPLPRVGGGADSQDQGAGYIDAMADAERPRAPRLIVVPLVLGIVGAIVLLIFAELGYQRLESAAQRVAGALELQSSLYEAQALVVDAETGQQGFLVTGREEYLVPYREALPKIEQSHTRLRELARTIGTPELQDAATRLNTLIGRRLAEMEATLALYERSGREVAFELMGTGIGRRTMDEIRAQVALMVTKQHDVLTEGATRWTRDLAVIRIGLQAMTAFTILLLLAVWMLVRRETSRREAQRLRLADEHARLEGVVEERTAELSELSNHLQTAREDEKSKIARDLHDEMGGILVSAKMDVASAAKRLGQSDPDASVRLARAIKSLDDGIAVKRRITEDLRPTLLDNLGIGAALDWLVRGTCERAGLACSLNLDERVGTLPPDISIAIYRIVQEALTNVVKYARAKRVTVDLVRGAGHVSLTFSDDGIGLPAKAPTNRLSHGIAGMRQRVRALHGEFSIHGTPGKGTVIDVHLPLSDG
ncbi:two-component system, NarL family, sensor histidine kinase UhpB [Burkholderiales bacterium]|nr:two-component system, NarL family, sensor histidine kinase UhpB [Burkholderiales bacterium]